MNFNYSITWLRFVGFLEGVSLLLLLFVAMPLKYYWGKPEMVKMVGSAHGFLFLLFVGWVIYEAVSRDWSTMKMTLPLIASSFIPFGTFYMDKHLLSKL